MKRFLILKILLFYLNFPILAGENINYQLPNYTYHKFANNFQVILVENHTNPLIAAVVVVKTGLRNETEANNGVSHMLEHMTFNGTDKRTQKELYDELDFYGIYLNAQTSEDYTTYMALNHSHKATEALDIMSDMLFNSTFPGEKFEKEKGIIAEEIRKDSENPAIISEHNLRKAFYKQPPFSLPVIGLVETVQNMKREEIVEYYEKYYNPDNMISIVIGDFETDKMVNLLQKYFGSAMNGTTERRKLNYDLNFPFTFLEKGVINQNYYYRLPAPSLHSDNYPPFEILNDYVFGNDENSVTEKLQKKAELKIQRAQASYEYHPEFAFLTFKISTASGVDTTKIREAIEFELENLKNVEFDRGTVNALKNKIAISEILQTEKILYYGFLKARELTVGGIDVFEKKIPALLNTEINPIKQFTGKYLELTKSPEKLFKPGSWLQNTEIRAYQKKEDKIYQTENSFQKTTLDNGLTIIHFQNSDNNVLALHFLFKNRSAWEPQNKTGIADFLHHCLFKASKNYPAQILSGKLNEIGAEIKAYDWDFIPYDDYYNIPHFSYIRFVTLDQFFDEAIQLAADNILNPEIEENFADVKNQMLGMVNRQANNAALISELNFNQLLYGKSHPLAEPVSGTPETISGISPADLSEFHRKYFSAGNTILSVVSSLPSSEVFEKIANYFNNMPNSMEKFEIPQIPLTEGIKTDSMNAGNRQAYINFGYCFEADTDHQHALNIMNSMLSSDLAFHLREQKGWAYRIGNSLSDWKKRYLLSANMGTGSKTMQTAISGIISEYENFKNKTLTEHELKKTQNSLTAAIVRRRASRENQAFVLGLNEFYGHPVEYYFNIFNAINRVSLEDVRAVQQKYLQTENYRLFYTIPSKSDPASGNEMPSMP